MAQSLLFQLNFFKFILTNANCANKSGVLIELYNINIKWNYEIKDCTYL